MIPEPNEFLSFLIAAPTLSDDQLQQLGITVLQGANSPNRCLLIPAAQLEAYQALLIQHLTPGFWNEVVGRDKILFLFKFRDSTIEKITYSPANSHRIATLCTALNNDPLEKTSDVPRYLAGNALYRDLIVAFHAK